MLKFIGKIVESLDDKQKGMVANDKKWVNLPVTPAIVQAAITDLRAKDDAVSAAEIVLEKARQDARDTVEKYAVLDGQIENLAAGIHATELNKLVEYNMDLPANKNAKSSPGKTVIASIVDDADGHGFVITHQSLADADGFEIERSAGQPADTEVLAPPYTYLKTTQKLSYTDDDVEKGKRYFYRSRAYNRRGYGPWSEPVSRVQ